MYTTTINYEDSETTPNRIYLSKKKEGLSTGTIVAIALVLAFVIVSFIVAMIYLRKDKPDHKKEVSSAVVNIKEI
jgi:mannitol-specific phosphotransferase system IIBC component